MNRTICVILPIALLATAAPVLAAPAAKAALRLTTIEDGFTGAACRVRFRQNDERIVAGMDYFEDNSAWHVGIDGKDYRMTDLAAKSSPNISLASNDRKTLVHIKRGKRVWVSRDPNYPAETHQATLTVTAGGRSGVFMAFMTCGDG